MLNAKTQSSQNGEAAGSAFSIQPLPPLLPGDHLLYDIRSPWRDPIGWAMDRAIKLKTWSDVAHIEVFAGDPIAPGHLYSTASRSAGVDLYPFRSDGLVYVLRPSQWDEAEADKYFQRIARGQKYDWLGLLCFTLAVHQGSFHKMFCSEYARNLDRAAGCPSFAETWPGDKTAPGSYLMSPAFGLIYDCDLDYAVPDGTADWRKAA
jgi:hypothetical protein